MILIGISLFFVYRNISKENIEPEKDIVIDEVRKQDIELENKEIDIKPIATETIQKEEMEPLLELIDQVDIDEKNSFILFVSESNTISWINSFTGNEIGNYKLNDDCSFQSENSIEISKPQIVNCQRDSSIYIFSQDGKVFHFEFPDKYTPETSPYKINISEDYKYLTFANMENNETLLTILDIGNNSKLKLKKEIQGNEVIDLSLIKQVQADCRYFGPFPRVTTSDFTIATTSCIDGWGMSMFKINNTNGTTSHINKVANIYFNRTNLEGNYYYFYDRKPNTEFGYISKIDLNNNSEVSEVEIRTLLTNNTAEGYGSPIVGITENHKYALLRSWESNFDDCESNCEINNKLVVLDITNKTIFESYFPNSKGSLLLTGEMNGNIYFLIESKQLKLMKFDTSTNEVKLVKIID